MSSWLLKAMLQGAISSLPARNRLNSVLQQHVTGSLTLSTTGFESKVAQCRHHLQSYRMTSGDGTLPASALELGTGWYPIVPIGLALAGIPRVLTIDISPLLDVQRIRRVLQLYASLLQSGRLRTLLPEITPSRAETVIDVLRGPVPRDTGELLDRLGVEVLVRDARASGLPAGSVDLLVSNNTLEHIPPGVLSEVMTEFRRVAAPGAVMDHFIDMSDHYAHFDGTISEFNYMRYSDRAWRIFNNRLHYQNRLRAPDYRRIIQQARFELVSESGEPGSLQALRRVTLAPRFRRYSPEDLLTLRSWMTATAPAP